MIRILTVGLSIALSASAASAQTSATSVPAVVTRSATPTVTGQTVSAGVPARAAGAVVLPGTQETAFATIRSTALDSRRGILPDSPVRLRDARSGRIISSQRTDKSGVVEFRAVDPGSYIVELLGTDDTVRAASQLINVNAGETVATLVQLPFRLAPLGGLFGHTTAQAIAITSAAAATGVLNAAATTDVSADGTNRQ